MVTLRGIAGKDKTASNLYFPASVLLTRSSFKTWHMLDWALKNQISNICLKPGVVIPHILGDLCVYLREINHSRVFRIWQRFSVGFGVFPQRLFK